MEQDILKCSVQYKKQQHWLSSFYLFIYFETFFLWLFIFFPANVIRSEIVAHKSTHRHTHKNCLFLSSKLFHKLSTGNSFTQSHGQVSHRVKYHISDHLFLIPLFSVVITTQYSHHFFEKIWKTLISAFSQYHWTL